MRLIHALGQSSNREERIAFKNACAVSLPKKQFAGPRCRRRPRSGAERWRPILTDQEAYYEGLRIHFATRREAQQLYYETRFERWRIKGQALIARAMARNPKVANLLKSK
jgi:hypothetical protein